MVASSKRLLQVSIVIILVVSLYRCFFHQSSGEVFGKKAIVIGASSGIGKALAQVLSNDGYEVGIVARRIDLLLALQKTLPHKSYIKQIDVGQSAVAMARLKELVREMNGYDVIIINSGIAFNDQDRDWSKQKQMIDVNVVGFAAIAHEALDHFIARGHGHLIGISSIAALRGGKHAFTYCATKAFDSTLLEGIRNTVRSLKLPICVTDVKPGYVDTDMVKNSKHKFWQVTPEQAAQQIYEAIKAKRNHAYVTKRWRLIAWFITLTPDWIYNILAD
jgi:short-subunit dehydrogenase